MALEHYQWDRVTIHHSRILLRASPCGPDLGFALWFEGLIVVGGETLSSRFNFAVGLAGQDT